MKDRNRRKSGDLKSQNIFTVNNLWQIMFIMEVEVREKK